MNSFDLMIERYKKELIDAKIRSMKQAINEVNESPQDDFELQSSEQLVAQNEKEGFEPFDGQEQAEDFFEDTALIDQQQDGVEENTDDGTLQQIGVSDDNSFNSSLENAEPTTTENNSGVGFFPNDAFGTLTVQVFAADRAYPISSASVIVTGSEDKKKYFDGYSDASGLVEKIVLPASNRVYSQSPQRRKPYAQYDLAIDHPRFEKRRYLGVPVFAGIESIQNVQLVPNDIDDAESETITESEPNSLLMDGGA